MPRTVFVAYKSWYDGRDILGIFSKREYAEEFCEKFRNAEELKDCIEIREYPVDDPGEYIVRYYFDLIASSEPPYEINIETLDKYSFIERVDVGGKDDLVSAVDLENGSIYWMSSSLKGFDHCLELIKKQQPKGIP